jgi:hypothetical protein
MCLGKGDFTSFPFECTFQFKMPKMKLWLKRNDEIIPFSFDNFKNTIKMICIIISYKYRLCIPLSEYSSYSL